jgi:hypothetical protein
MATTEDRPLDVFTTGQIGQELVSRFLEVDGVTLHTFIFDELQERGFKDEACELDRRF